MLLGGCVAPTKARVAAMLVGNAAILCDWKQTQEWSNGGRWEGSRKELNPLLGERPTAIQLHTAALLALVSNTVLTFALRPKWATAWSFGVAAGEGLNVLTMPHNPVWRWHTDGACN